MPPLHALPVFSEKPDEIKFQGLLEGVMSTLTDKKELFV